ncbi:MAG: hypothetical protein JNL53_18750, partial [Cyclobacteriaceae bacterium]|nr:hypothetical protein [Cyclobacteriaceae bacterium]
MKTLIRKLDIGYWMLDSRCWTIISSIKYPVSRIIKLSIMATLMITGTSTAQIITLDSILATIDRQNPMLQQFDHKVSA